MPLPDAEPTPNKANIYDQLSNIKLGDLTLTQFDILRNPLFLNGQSEDVLRRLKLIYEISNFYPTGAPLPGTFSIVSATATTAGNVDMFEPSDDGSVYQLVGMALGATYTGQTSVRGYLQQPGSPDYLNSVQLNGPTTDDYTALEINEPVFFSYPGKLYINFGGSGTGGTSAVTAAIIRVR